jgi:hypothetical protein
MKPLHKPPNRFFLPGILVSGSRSARLARLRSFTIEQLTPDFIVGQVANLRPIANRPAGSAYRS